MSASAAAVIGWTVAGAALAAVLLVRRALARRLQSVAEACHELRGPLAAVSLAVELGGRQGELRAERLRAIELELGRAARALDDLEAVRDRRPSCRGLELVAVHELLADLVEAWRPAGAVRGVQLALGWAGPEALVSGDRLRLAQAAGNLISNAVEHGEGDVEVSGRAGPGGVRIEIRDHGPGLGAPVAELIRRSRSGARIAGGGRHGHGLRIAQSVAGAHGGRLAAAPTDRGARLVLELPAATDPGTAQIRPG